MSPSIEAVKWSSYVSSMNLFKLHSDSTLFNKCLYLIILLFQTAVSKDPLPPSTLDDIGVPRAFVASDGRFKSHVSFNGGYTSTGDKLIPHFILEGSHQSPISHSKLKNIIDKFGDSVYLSLSTSGYANQRTKRDYFVHVVFPYVRANNLIYPIFLLDAYSGNFYDNNSKTYDIEFVDFCLLNGVVIKYFNGGLTALKQVPDTHIHRPLKINIAHQHSDRRLQIAEKVIDRLSRGEVCDVEAEFHQDEAESRLFTVQATIKALAEVSSEMIISAFKQNGLSNKLDGSEEDLVIVSYQLHNVNRLHYRQKVFCNFDPTK